MANILPRDLPATASVSPAASIIVDDAGQVSKATPAQVLAGAGGVVAADLAADDGAEAIGFQQTGSTHLRTLDAKARERLSINDFTGADPSGVADSTTALTSAIAAAASTGQPLYIDGVYRYTAKITVPAKVRLIGRGYTSYAPEQGKATLLKDFDAGTDCGIDFVGGDCGAEFIHFATTAGKTGDIVQLSGERSFLHYCSAAGAGRDNVRVGTDATPSNTNCWSVIGLYTVGAGRHGLYVNDPTDGTDANGGTLIECDSRDNGGDGIRVDAAYWNTIITPVCQGNTGAGIRFTANARGANVIGGDLEGNDEYQGVIEDGAQGIVIDAPNILTGPWIDQGPVGMNRIRQWDISLSRMIDGDGLALVNPRADGVTAIEMFADVGENNVASLRATQAGTSGGTLDIYTKRDGNPPARALRIDEKQLARFDAAVATNVQAITYSASMTIDVAAGGIAEITANNGTAFSIATSNAAAGQYLTIRVKNTSGGALGAITWTGFKTSGSVAPSTGTGVVLDFYFDGTNWIERGRSGTVPN